MGEGGWGHWDVDAVMTSSISATWKRALTRGEQTAYALALNWVPVDHVRFMLNYAQSDMDRTVGADEEATVISLRSQFDF